MAEMAVSALASGSLTWRLHKNILPFVGSASYGHNEYPRLSIPCPVIMGIAVRQQREAT